MEIPIIKIGNSRGILLSKTLLERYKFGEKLKIEMKHNHIELRPIDAPRKGWEDQFKQMHQNGDDRLMTDDLFVDEDLEQWD